MPAGTATWSDGSRPCPTIPYTRCAGKALVTGGSSGIAAAIATAFGMAGAAVGVNYRSSAQGAARVVEAIRGAGRRGVCVTGGCRERGRVEAMFRAFGDTFGRIDILGREFRDSAGLSVRRDDLGPVGAPDRRQPDGAVSLRPARQYGASSPRKCCPLSCVRQARSPACPPCTRSSRGLGM